MGKLLGILLGLGIIGYLVYVIIMVIIILFDANSNTWQALSTHLVVAGIFVALLIIGYFIENSKKKERKKH